MKTIFTFWQSKYILQKYYFDGGQKVMLVSSNEWSLVKKLLRFHQEFYYIVDYLRIRKRNSDSHDGLSVQMGVYFSFLFFPYKKLGSGFTCSNKKSKGCLEFLIKRPLKRGLLFLWLTAIASPSWCALSILTDRWPRGYFLRAPEDLECLRSQKN